MKFFLTLSTLILSFVALASAGRQLRSTCKVILAECYYSEWPRGCSRHDFTAYEATETNKFCCLKYVDIAYDPTVTTATTAETPQSPSPADVSEANSNESSAGVTTVVATTAPITPSEAFSDSAENHTSAPLIATPKQRTWDNENGENQERGEVGGSGSKETMFYRKHFSTSRKTFQKPKIIFPKRKPKPVATVEPVVSSEALSESSVEPKKLEAFSEAQMQSDEYFVNSFDSLFNPSFELSQASIESTSEQPEELKAFNELLSEHFSEELKPSDEVAQQLSETSFEAIQYTISDSFESSHSDQDSFVPDQESLVSGLERPSRPGHLLRMEHPDDDEQEVGADNSGNNREDSKIDDRNDSGEEIDDYTGDAEEISEVPIENAGNETRTEVDSEIDDFDVNDVIASETDSSIVETAISTADATGETAEESELQELEASENIDENLEESVGPDDMGGNTDNGDDSHDVNEPSTDETESPDDESAGVNENPAETDDLGSTNDEGVSSAGEPEDGNPSTEESREPDNEDADADNIDPETDDLGEPVDGDISLGKPEEGDQPLAEKASEPPANNTSEIAELPDHNDLRSTSFTTEPETTLRASAEILIATESPKSENSVTTPDTTKQTNPPTTEKTTVKSVLIQKVGEIAPTLVELVPPPKIRGSKKLRRKKNPDAKDNRQRLLRLRSQRVAAVEAL